MKLKRLLNLAVILGVSATCATVGWERAEAERGKKFTVKESRLPSPNKKSLNNLGAILGVSNTKGLRKLAGKVGSRCVLHIDLTNEQVSCLPVAKAKSKHGFKFCQVKYSDNQEFPSCETVPQLASIKLVGKSGKMETLRTAGRNLKLLEDSQKNDASELIEINGAFFRKEDRGKLYFNNSTTSESLHSNNNSNNNGMVTFSIIGPSTGMYASSSWSGGTTQSSASSNSSSQTSGGGASGDSTNNSAEKVPAKDNNEEKKSEEEPKDKNGCKLGQKLASSSYCEDCGAKDTPTIIRSTKPNGESVVEYTCTQGEAKKDEQTNQEKEETTCSPDQITVRTNGKDVCTPCKAGFRAENNQCVKEEADTAGRCNDLSKIKDIKTLFDCKNANDYVEQHKACQEVNSLADVEGLKDACKPYKEDPSWWQKLKHTLTEPVDVFRKKIEDATEGPTVPDKVKAGVNLASTTRNVLIGGGIGFATGGPVGAVVGAGAGYIWHHAWGWLTNLFTGGQN